MPGAMDMCHGRWSSSVSVVQFVVVGVDADATVVVDAVVDVIMAVAVAVAAMVVSLPELSSSMSVAAVEVKEVVVLVVLPFIHSIAWVVVGPSVVEVSSSSFIAILIYF